MNFLVTSCQLPVTSCQLSVASAPPRATGNRQPATLLFALFTLLLATTAFAQATDYRDIKTPPLRAFNPPTAKRIQLDNGMVIFLM